MRVVDWLRLVLDLLARPEEGVPGSVLATEGESIYGVPELAWKPEEGRLQLVGGSASTAVSGFVCT